MLRTKIHRATVTGAELNYVGSVSIDRELMDLAGILPYEQVAVLDVDNGARFETYAIVGGPGEICLNGAAARLVSVGDRVILLTYADYDEEELADYAPVVVHVDGANQPVSEAEALALSALVSTDDPARRIGRPDTEDPARRIGRPDTAPDPEVAGPTGPDRRAAVGTGIT